MTRLETAKLAWAVVDEYIREHPERFTPQRAHQLGTYMADLITREQRKYDGVARGLAARKPLSAARSKLR